MPKIINSCGHNNSCSSNNGCAHQRTDKCTGIDAAADGGTDHARDITCYFHSCKHNKSFAFFGYSWCAINVHGSFWCADNIHSCEHICSSKRRCQ